MWSMFFFNFAEGNCLKVKQGFCFVDKITLYEILYQDGWYMYKPNTSQVLC